MSAPENLKYTPSHEWVAVDGKVATVGITDHAQQELSELVFVELPETGRKVAKGEPLAVVESVKSANDIFAPVGGTVVETNSALEEEPAGVNADPYGNGWIFKLEIGDESELGGLLDAAGYEGEIG